MKSPLRGITTGTIRGSVPNSKPWHGAGSGDGSLTWAAVMAPISSPLKTLSNYMALTFLRACYARPKNMPRNSVSRPASLRPMSESSPTPTISSIGLSLWLLSTTSKRKIAGSVLYRSFSGCSSLMARLSSPSGTAGSRGSGSGGGILWYPGASAKKPSTVFTTCFLNAS